MPNNAEREGGKRGWQGVGSSNSNVKELVGRLHRMAYRPQPVRRVHIPKGHEGDTGQAFEDLRTLVLTNPNELI